MFAVTCDGRVFGWGCSDDGALGTTRVGVDDGSSDGGNDNGSDTDTDTCDGLDRSKLDPKPMQVKLFCVHTRSMCLACRGGCK